MDDDNRIIGIVTVDDVIDILHETATEDMLKMAGVGEDYVETQSVFKGTRIRLPWLFASCLGGIANFFIIGRFESTLAQLTGLAAFLPIIMGMGGNIGTQSATIVVRGDCHGPGKYSGFCQSHFQGTWRGIYPRYNLWRFDCCCGQGQFYSRILFLGIVRGRWMLNFGFHDCGCFCGDLGAFDFPAA